MLSVCNMPPSIHYMPKVCDNTKFMSGQYQDVSGHLETHLCWAIGQSEKKEKQTVIFFGTLCYKNSLLI
jgi:hypothetical protein